MIEQIINYRPDSPVYTNGLEMPPAKNTKIGLISDTHIHREYEFLYVTSGIVKCVTGNSEIILKSGDILFINSYIPHSTYYETVGTDMVFVQFNSPFVSDSAYRYIIRFLNFCDTPVYTFSPGNEYYDDILRCLSVITKEHNGNRPFWKDFIHSNIFMIMAILKRCGVLSDFISTDENGIEKIMPAIEYINANYNTPITTTDLSEKLNFNESYFCRLFKNSIGTTATEYLNFVRVCKAEHMLRHGSSVSDAAYGAGFASLSYFNRIFRKYKYYSPGEYKKIAKNQTLTTYGTEKIFEVEQK